VVLDFYDRLKSVSRDMRRWTTILRDLGNRDGENGHSDSGDPVDALSIIVHRDFAYDRGRALAAKMKELIPRQMFEVAIQAAIGAKVIARETVGAIRKNVIAKCYGGISAVNASCWRNKKRQEADEEDWTGGDSQEHFWRFCVLEKTAKVFGRPLRNFSLSRAEMV